MKGPLSKNNIIAGRYEVMDFLGEGGMQYVYRALDRVAERHVALKTPKNLSAEKRFKRGAVVAAKVNHPNVAKTLDYVSENGRLFLIEELVQGRDLKEALLTRSEYLDPYLTAKIFHHLAKGVAAAHHAGVVHRDLKPTNIMVTGDYSLEELKITDFGIAKIVSDELQEAAEGGDGSLVASQTAVGALPYMAPEAIETPKSVDQRADIWSVGAIIYHLLCGSHPFGNGLAAIPKILAAAPPAIPDFVFSNPQFAPLAKEILDIAKQCIQKDANARPSADDLVQLCSRLCYTASPRTIGVVNNIMHSAWGFIDSTPTNVFYHQNNVFGQLPKIGDSVVFASYDGGGSPRALPVLRIT